MPLIYAVISRGNTILCKFADCLGNFTEIVADVISQVPPQNNKMTFRNGNYHFHYICQDKLIYMCIVDLDYERSRAFLFLNEIKTKFLSTYGLTAATALPYAMNTEFARVLSAEMKKCNESREYDSMSRVHGQIDELKDIMIKNIESVTARGERLELLVNKSENLRDNAVSFRQTSRTLARTLFWRNIRMYFLLTLLLLFIAYIVTSMFCGGLTWSSCR